MRGDEISNAAEQLATDLDKAGPTGEVIVQRILTAPPTLPCGGGGGGGGPPTNLYGFPPPYRAQPSHKLSQVSKIFHLP
jgi:hypothetical protein